MFSFTSHTVDIAAELTTFDVNGYRPLRQPMPRQRLGRRGSCSPRGCRSTRSPRGPAGTTCCAHGISAGPVWRGVDRYGRRPRAGRMTPHAISAVITRRAGAAGLDGDYGGHSLRRGFATSALAGGATERAVQNHGRWKSPLSMAPYVDRSPALRRHQPHPHARPVRTWGSCRGE